ncbi:type II toxin-antitoxin system Phd/YefM family antitoxin [Salmonella enterica]|nr:type II toxin-antitoxin system Phd/YefM family antitoxin [Salmonella enterica]ECO7324692.1 type II toxin-antitoxin system Phd/YefM family antitoxin [Salmonella enterica]ECZ0806883.1 type II toxin-antitoxin system Phd/YefM family antitoxin [Salmonella enterica]EEK4465191.1 type II toxin-antitoxin system prevent-host-death family antitoxin [Salmonella enterica]EHF0215271.1 type II toxin-antitoxin system Phd/YefM family antitoxin [Salmonella enterica]
MFNCTYSHARDNLASLLELAVEEGQPVEIQRRNRGPAVLVDKEAFERYRKIALDAEFDEIMQTHGDIYTALANK